jgi:class 3 adenylate cyclase/pimeloyl-ACP methyl ester carboxylesterase
MQELDVRYARSGDVSIAYATVGDGPFDVVFVGGSILTMLADGPWSAWVAQIVGPISAFCRLILFDKRGTGLSDRSVGIPDLQTRMDDIRAVMDAVGSRRAAILGVSEGGPMSILFAATYPERTAALVLYATIASNKRADDYPWAETEEWWEANLRERAKVVGTPAWIDDFMKRMTPSLFDEPGARDTWRHWIQASGSPGSIIALAKMNAQIDVRYVLPAISVPTVIVQRRGDDEFYTKAGGYMADRIAGAELVELEGADHGWWYMTDQIVDPIESFLTRVWSSGEWDVVASDRILATVMFTDIVDSTTRLTQLGDRGWRELLAQHHALVRRQLVRYAGREVDTAGDGFFASFDGPARAIRCASAIVQQMPALDLQVRVGLHTGECELADGKVAGVAVHIGARVAEHAAPGEVLVSNTVKDLVAGSGIEFSDRGNVEFKGLPGEWRLYAVQHA